MRQPVAARLKRDQARPPFGADCFDGLQRGTALDGRHAQSTGFDDPRLLEGDLFQRIPQEFDVIEADVGDDADERPRNDIGRIQPAFSSPTSNTA